MPLAAQNGKEISQGTVGCLPREIDRDEALRSFHADMRLEREYGATGFPTLLFLPTVSSAAQPEAPEGLLVNGHRSSQTYLQVLNRVVPGLEPAAPRPIPQLLADYGPLTTRELAEISGTKVDQLKADLDVASMRGASSATRFPSRGAYFKQRFLGLGPRLAARARARQPGDLAHQLSRHSWPARPRRAAAPGSALPIHFGVQRTCRSCQTRR